MAGSYLLHNELHYNGLMTYLGLTLGSIFFYFIQWSFTANDGSFYEKRRVVFGKTTCCFCENDVLFLRKRRLVLWKAMEEEWTTRKSENGKIGI